MSDIITLYYQHADANEMIRHLAQTMYIEGDGVASVDFDERMPEIHRELISLQAESNDLMDAISQNMKDLGL